MKGLFFFLKLNLIGGLKSSFGIAIYTVGFSQNEDAIMLRTRTWKKYPNFCIFDCGSQRLACFE